MISKTFRYAFLTCTLAYLIAAVLLFIFSVGQTGWNRIDSNTVMTLTSGLTLALSEFQWWGSFYYLAILVPWIGSSLVLVILLYLVSAGFRLRRLLGGLSVFAYYLAMFLAFIIHGLTSGWGDVGYYLLWLWPVAGFGLGYLAATIAEKILKPDFRLT